MMKTLLATAISVIFGITTSSNAETLSFPSFRIEVGDGWVHSIERGAQAHYDWGDLISLYDPNGVGILKMQSYSAPDSVSKEILRNMTNVDSSKPLTWQNWETMLVISIIIWRGVHSIDNGGLLMKGQ